VNNLKSIEQHWQKYAAMVFKKMKPGPVQYEETKQAFFSGCFALLMATEEIGMDHVSEEEGFKYFDAIRAEGLAFGKEVIRKYAERN
jgi:hypothetical protein